MKKLSFTLLILSVLSLAFIEKPESKQEIEWLSIKEAYLKNEQEPRKIFIDVYTDWCGWCKKMDKETFNDPKVVELVNEKFYAVKLDAEDRKPIILKGDTTTAQIIARSMGVTGYPTIVFMKEDFQTIQPVPGYQNPDKFINSLQQVLKWK